MKKKLILLIVLAFMLKPVISFAQEGNQSTTNQFGITVVPGDIPVVPGGGGGGAGGIIAGATAGGVVAAGGAALLSPLFLPGLLIGAAASMDTPLLPVCLCDGKIIGELQTYADKFSYILKAIAQNCLHNPCNSKYILITDTTIMPGAYNVATLKLPKELAQNNILSVKLTQISNPFKVFRGRPEINSRLYVNKSIEDINKLYKNQAYWKIKKGNGEVVLDTISSQEQAGILKKQGDIDLSKDTNDVGILVTSYNLNGSKSHLPQGVKGTCQKYAVLVELSNLPYSTLIK